MSHQMPASSSASASPPPSESDTARPPRKRKHVSQACINCRQRRKACDDSDPCGTCRHHNDTCRRPQREDYRKSLSREEAKYLRGKVDELLGRVDELESELEVARLMATTSSATGPSQSTETFLSPARASLSPVVSNARLENNPSPRRFSAQAGNVDDLMVKDLHGGFRVHSLASAFRDESVAEPMQSSTADRTAARPRAPSVTGFERFLPDVFLTQEQHDTALDRFFRYFASFCQRATPHLFYRDMRVALALDDTAKLAAEAPNYSPMLHNMILALGLSYANEPHLRALSTRRQFLEEGMRHIDRECVVSCVATVQALAFRAGYSSTMGDFSLGWINFGQAIRLSYALGLHIDTSTWAGQITMSQEILTQRNVTFWTCFCQDVTFSNYLGRAPSIVDYSVPLPEPDAATDQHPWTWPPGPHARRPAQPSYLSTTMVATSSLMQIAAQITKALYTEREDVATLVNEGIIQRFHDELNTWFNGLSDPLVVTEQAPALPHVLMLHLAWSWVVLLLYQPFLLSARLLHTLPTAAAICQVAALKILSHSTMYRDTHGLPYMSPAAPQILYTTGRMFLFSAAAATDPSQAVAFFQKALTCIEHLEELGTTWPSGGQKAGVLRRKMEEKYTQPTPLAPAPLPAAKLLTPLAMPRSNCQLDPTLAQWVTDDIAMMNDAAFDEAQSIAAEAAEPLGPQSQPELMAYFHAGMPSLNW